jgi:TonB family protein
VLTPVPTQRSEKVSLFAGRGASLAVHLLVLGALLFAGRQAWKVHPVNTRGGSHSTVLYWGNPAGTITTRPKSRPTPKTQQARLKSPVKPPAPQPPQPEQLDSSGRSATPSPLTGTGSSSENATPAFPVYSPSPQVADRSLLPRADENVVVDVNVSAQGEVLDEKLIHGLGNSIDQTILDIVKSWKFHPATVDGNAVASVAELVFPLNQHYRG